jgi:CheY-like chemotaxis protein
MRVEAEMAAKAPSALADSVDVLIVEDDAPSRAALRLLLEQQGYRCAEAENGREALALAWERPPRCVLLDLVIPELDGLTVARHLRADPRTAGVRIHCLTGLIDPAVREEARQAGCEGFLTKPVDPPSLLEALGGSQEATEAKRPVEIGGLTKEAAETLLDWLENQGCTERTLTVATTGRYLIRFTCPPGLRLVRTDGPLCFERRRV